MNPSSPHFESTRLRAAVRRIRHYAHVLRHPVDEDAQSIYAPRDGDEGKRLEAVLRRIQGVDRVDAQVMHRWGSATRVTVRAWLDPEELGISGSHILAIRGRGVLSETQARALLLDRYGIIHGFVARDGKKNTESATSHEVTVSDATLQHVIDRIVQRTWNHTGAHLPALAVYVMYREGNNVWAAQTMAAGFSDVVVSPQQLYERYGSPASHPSWRP